MRSPIILEGQRFNWDASAASEAVDDEGNVNWQAAFAADPGTMQCPNCKQWLWREGYKVKCPTCKHIFFTTNEGASTDE